MDKIKIADIKIRMDLYPRLEIDTKKVQEYSENIEKLPPIEINQDNVLTDGMHRIKAYKQAGLDEIEYTIFETKDDDDIYMRAIELNAKFGIQLNYKDKKKIAVDVTRRKLKKDDDATEIRKRLVKVLSVVDDTYNKWTKNIREEYDKQIKAQIIQEYLKAELTKQQIQDKFDIKDYGKINKILDETLKKINLLFTRNLLEYWENIDETLKTKLLKEYRTEEEIKEKKLPTFEEFYNRLRKEFTELSNFNPNLYNIWNYGNQGDTDTTVFGTLPQDMIEQLLYYYTEPFDVVYDPFGGSGITVNACKKWYRRYYVSDKNPTEIAAIKGIKQWAIQNDLPKDLPVPKLVFLDPPYWKQSQGKYSDDDNDLGNMSIDDFYLTIESLIKNLKKKMNGGYIALIIGATQWKDDIAFEDHAFKIYKIFDKLGFTIKQRIQCAYSTEQYNGNQVNKVKENKEMLNLYRDLMVFQQKFD